MEDDFMRGYKAGMEDEKIIWINAIDGLKNDENAELIEKIFERAGVKDVD